jgi:hypothetical protein
VVWFVVCTSVVCEESEFIVKPIQVLLRNKNVNQILVLFMRIMFHFKLFFKNLFGAPSGSRVALSFANQTYSFHL